MSASGGAWPDTGKIATPGGLLTGRGAIAAPQPCQEATFGRAGMRGYSGEEGGWYKCARSGGDPGPTNANPSQGHVDATSITPQTKWPHGTCCNDGASVIARAPLLSRPHVSAAPTRIMNMWHTALA